MRPSSSTRAAGVELAAWGAVAVFTSLGSVTVLLSTMGIGLGACGDQFLKSFEEGRFVRGPAGPEARIQFVGTERPAENQQAVLLDELAGHAAVLADAGQAGRRDEQRPGSGPFEKHAFRVDGQFRVR